MDYVTSDNKELTWEQLFNLLIKVSEGGCVAVNIIGLGV